MMDIKHLLSIYIKIKSNEGICPIHFFSKNKKISHSNSQQRIKTVSPTVSNFLQS